MNREIKFRAWDIKNKNMFFVGGIVGIMFGTAITNKYDFEKTFWCMNYELMQYTGLKDKNGKEIYERDILQFETGTCRQVVYQSPSFVMKKNIKDKTWTEFALAPSENQFETIIGNIYENPELLKES